MAKPSLAAGADLRLRRAGFLAAAAGACSVGIGALLPWLAVGADGLPAELTPSDRGIDHAAGIAALALAVLVLVATLVARVGGGGRARRGAAALALVAALGALGVAAWFALVAPTRAERDVAGEIARLLGVEELPTEARAALHAERLGGLWLTLAGGGVATAGGALTLAWARRARPAPIATGG
jgi:hypothetical protein